LARKHCTASGDGCLLTTLGGGRNKKKNEEKEKHFPKEKRTEGVAGHREIGQAWLLLNGGGEEGNSPANKDKGGCGKGEGQIYGEKKKEK